MNEPVAYRFDLCCTSDPTRAKETKRIDFTDSVPCTVGDLKRELEERLEIPATLAKLKLNSVILNNDGTSLDTLRICKEETFIVHYYHEADCRKINACLKRMSQLLGSMEKWKESKYENQFKPSHSDFISEPDIFLPWLNPKTYANKLYFIAKGGLELIMKILRIRLEAPTYVIIGQMEFGSVIQVMLAMISRIGENDVTRQAIVQVGGVETCRKVLLWKPARKLGNSLNFFYNRQAIGKSIEIFSSLCYLPELKLQIVNDNELIEQMMSMTLIPSPTELLNQNETRGVLATFLALSHDIATHQPLILHQKFPELIAKDHSNADWFGAVHTLVRYHKNLLLSILLLNSAQYFTKETKTLAQESLDSFLTDADSLNLSIESDYHIKWGTMIPLIKALYPTNQPSLDEGLCNACKQTVLLALHTMLQRDYHSATLMNEEVVDYILCLLWYSSGGVKDKAQLLVELVRDDRNMDYQPPSLLNMCKAAVAVHYCGLETVMNLSVPRLADKIMFQLNHRFFAKIFLIFKH